MTYSNPQDINLVGAGGELTAQEEIRVQEIQALGDTATNEALGKTSGSVVKKEVATTYTLPTATASTLGGVKVGSRLSIDGSGVLSADAASGVSGSGTINEIAYFDTATSIASLAVATYPSLTELSYIKGVSSAIQTQISAKAPSTAPTFATSINGSYLTASEILITDADKKIVSAPVATYPSLTELSYVKGLSSAIQTQLGTKAPSANPTFTGTVILPKTLEIQDTSADHQYVLAVSELTADRTITLPLLTGADEFVFKDHAQTLTNKTIDGDSNTFVDIPYTALAAGTDGNLITWGADAEPALVATGDAGQVLTSNGAGAAPTFQAAAGGASIPTMKLCTVFEDIARFSTAVIGAGTVTLDASGFLIATSNGGGDSARARWTIFVSATASLYAGSPSFSCSIYVGSNTAAGTGSTFFGLGTPTVAGTGHTYTPRHMGFKIIKNSAVATLYATQADNTTETASAALTTVVNTNSLDLIGKVNSTTSVDYYWRVDGGALSAATNLTTNMPSGNDNQFQVSTSNDSTAFANNFYISSNSYER